MVKISSKVTGVILSNGCITPTTCLILFEFSAKIPFLKYLVGLMEDKRLIKLPLGMLVDLK